MLNVIGILLVMDNYAWDLGHEIKNPKTDDYFTNEEINKILGLPDGVDPVDYLYRIEDEAYDLYGKINPKTGKYWTSTEILLKLGILGDHSYV